MLERRKIPLPPDVQYCLDGAIENGHITAATDLAIRLYGDAAVLDAIWEKPTQGWRRRLLGNGFETEAYGLSLIRQLPDEEVSALLYLGFCGLIRGMEEKAEWLANWNFEDSTKGGCHIPFRKRWLLDRSENPTKKVARRLRSEKRIRRYIAGIREIQHSRALWRGLVELTRGRPILAYDRESIEALFAQLEDQTSERQRIIRQEAAYQALLRQMDAGARKAKRETEAARRKVLKRASRIAAAIVGLSAVSAFAKGEPVRLDGEKIAIEARLAHSIGAAGHGAVNVSVLDLDGTRLCRLCVYQDLPALDQLASLALHVQAGAEMEILQTGNCFAIEPAGYEHPVLKERVKSQQEVIIPPPGQVASVQRLDRDRFRANMAAYDREMRPVYRTAIAEYCAGREASRIPWEIAGVTAGRI
jgi:hypothetical protein